jgi:signal peptidase II
MQAARGASLTPGDPNHPRSRRGPLGIFVGVALVTYVVDLVTKTIALRELDGRDSVPVVGDLLQLTLVRNPGAAFGTGTSYTVLLSLVAVGATITVLVLSRRLADPLWGFGLGCLLGGVLGNLTDRLFREPGPLRGHVIDFLQLPNWPVFNVADMCINLAAAVIIVQAFRGVNLRGHRVDDTAQERS